MSKTKAEIATELYNDFIKEIGEISIAGEDKSDERLDSVKHLLIARSKFKTLMRLYKESERSGSTEFEACYSSDRNQICHIAFFQT